MRKIIIQDKASINFKMNHIGINAFHANASIALFKKNNLLFAIEEERLNRIKNWFGFIRFGLDHCNILYLSFAVI